MSVTNLIDEKLIKQELVVFLRNQDVFSTTVRGVTTSQDTGTFSSNSTHTLTTNPTKTKNVRNVKVGGSDLVFGTDYTVDYSTGVISFTSAQTGAFIIDYDQGSTDKIFSDFPKVELKISNYPRLAVGITSSVTEENELGAGSNITNFLISIYVYGIGTENTNNYIKSVREAILNNKNDFYYLRFVTPKNISPMINEPARAYKIFTQVLDLEAPLNIEIIT